MGAVAGRREEAHTPVEADKQVRTHSRRHTHTHTQGNKQRQHIRLDMKPTTHPPTRTHALIYNKTHTLRLSAVRKQSTATSARHRDKHFTHSSTQQRGGKEGGRDGEREEEEEVEDMRQGEGGE